MIFFADWKKLIIEYRKEVVKRKLAGLWLENLNITKSLHGNRFLR
jgi:hypothetical protein